MSRFNFDRLVISKSDEFDSNIGMIDNLVSNDEKYPIHEINVNLLDIIDNQPFKPYDDENLDELTDSIATNGLLSPLVVNKDGDRYTILCGRNRFRAINQLGWEKVPCKILDVDNEQANLILVDSNLNQRQDLSPSEKAIAYNMKINSLCKIKNQSFTQSVNDMAESEKTTKRNIYRYIRLSSLNTRLLELVDVGMVTITAGVILADFHEQELLANYLQEKNKKINDKTATELLELEQAEKITYEALDKFFFTKKSNTKNIKINFESIIDFLPKNDMNEAEIENYIIAALKMARENSDGSVDLYNQNNYESNDMI